MWVAIAIGFILLGVWIILGMQPYGKNRGRDDFDGPISSLLLARENGGSLLLRDRKSDLNLRIRRTIGNDEVATLGIEIPRAAWSEPHLGDLQQVFQARGLETITTNDTDSTTLLIGKILVPDIWDEYAGVQPARIVNRLLDALSSPSDARFDLLLEGPVSRRVIGREMDL